MRVGLFKKFGVGLAVGLGISPVVYNSCKPTLLSWMQAREPGADVSSANFKADRVANSADETKTSSHPKWTR